MGLGSSNRQTDDWNAKLYDERHRFVSAYGEDLIQWLAPKEGECVLDLGCGTGDLTEQIHQLGSRVIGVDVSESMIEQAKGKFPHLDFQVAEATDLSFSETFDAVFSNAVLHWIKDAEEALTVIYRSLKPGGRFVAEFGGKGNVETIVNTLADAMSQADSRWSKEELPWFFPSIGQYTSLMEQVGFRVTHALHFNRPTLLEGGDGIRHWLAMFAESVLEGKSETERAEIVRFVEAEVKDALFDGTNWWADYKRIRVVGMKQL
ncbi:methyltransferase domain-containing protein [Halalkalibacterium halodurans]|uniref:class I SAM-dependent methyltransferase n=1 Tax=Halalkalibacterium halodurans TaxID=86665 RepID=UPI002E1D9971|nr:methyltransferase domain-containing protein [Halalkalibacterium halodurans]MED4081632.1 methyltransferase domain-containing protein [Halalkalibacterium halodurans]MED4084956.1 methyltransferase domain-containing protein [Halalkalibacterium halodurans]MED4104157.1 methyltransferase domain-containing protein [Halalkalibacterium halodurans]MED4110525.1 methyltransferase domain-containing protein [Halalkalibacterium halodurans]MED4125285.1 methyltransferase domain-containing protein [Halalkalib